MLESEAKTKWCPKYQATSAGDNRWTKGGDFARKSTCIGPQCACWIDTGYFDKAGERSGRCGLAR